MERISVIIDAKVDGFTAGFKKMRADIAEADTLTGKFKAGFAGVADGVKANAGMLAATAGAALVAFGAKAVQVFTDTSKAAIDLSKATGLSIEQASRWIAVGDDFGVTGDQIAAAIGRIGKELDSAKWDKYGIATRDAAGQAKDANVLFLDVLEVLNNTAPAERAKVGAELLGRGWQAVAPILGQTREAYEAMLGTVEDGQVITTAEASKAEKMRLAQDKLSDALGDLTLAFGELFSAGSPVLNLLADMTTKAAELVAVATGNDAKDMSEPIKAFADAIKDADTGTGEGIKSVLDGFSDLVTEVGDSRSTLDKAGKGYSQFFGELADKGTAATVQLEDFRKAFSDLAGTNPSAAVAVYDALVNLNTAAANGSESARAWIDEYGLTPAIMAELAEEANGATTATDGLTTATNLATREVDRGSDSLVQNMDATAANTLARESLTTATERAEEAQRDLNAAQLASIDTGYAVADAQDRFTESMEALAIATDDPATGVNELDQAQRSAEQSALAMAQANVANAEAMAIAAGAPLSAAESNYKLIESLYATVMTLDENSPVRAALLGHIGTLQGVPANVATTVTADTEQAQEDIGKVLTDAEKLNTETDTKANAETATALEAVQTLQGAVDGLAEGVSIPIDLVGYSITLSQLRTLRTELDLTRDAADRADRAVARVAG